MQFTAENLLVRGARNSDEGAVVEVTPTRAGWDTIYFAVHRLLAGKSLTLQATAGHEAALVSLSGVFNVRAAGGTWDNIGGRASVFAGLPHALYLTPSACAGTITVTASSDCEFAYTTAPAVGDTSMLKPVVVKPENVRVEIRGGDHATRHINSIMPPGFPCSRLVIVEVYTPAGNWSSYPPHKHDAHRTGTDGKVVEADLDEIYYYKIDPPAGFAVQRVYTDEGSPLQRAGRPIDATVTARDNDVVLVPEGYHPVSAPPGYTAYYLNVLAGTVQGLTASDDPVLSWVKTTYKTCDPRVPVYDVSGAASLFYGDLKPAQVKPCQ
eukprot:TRINITY_DN3421_c0_g1_i1.p1 TRINITY_DN3421_c0_g1~~TRINITY_DN3421_c0_g1_i1.p1  ORF type:complete len:324 (-),score=71.31 TRINITY_DN3421_c0_g1_i1:31-1002(-)